MRAAPVSRRVTKTKVWPSFPLALADWCDCKHRFLLIFQVCGRAFQMLSDSHTQAYNSRGTSLNLRWNQDLHSLGHVIQALLAHAQYPSCLDKMRNFKVDMTLEFKSLCRIRTSYDPHYTTQLPHPISQNKPLLYRPSSRPYDRDHAAQIVIAYFEYPSL